MKLFKEVYVNQNEQLVKTKYRSAETVEILAYSVLLLHTDLHNPNVGKLGKRMTKTDFIKNNGQIDAGEDVSKQELEDIFDRVAKKEFKTMLDQSDRMRQLDLILTGPLKTDNFVQKNRRFVGWIFCQEIENVGNQKSPNRGNHRWRYLLVFNDILIVVKTSVSRRQSNSFYELAQTVGCTQTGSMNDVSSWRKIKKTKLNSAEFKKNMNMYSSIEPLQGGTYYQVRKVYPILDLSVLVFESQSKFGLFV